MKYVGVEIRRIVRVFLMLLLPSVVGLVGFAGVTTAWGHDRGRDKTVVRAMRSGYGRILADSSGFALYVWCEWESGGAKCTRRHSAPFSRPLIARGSVEASTHVRQSKLGTIRLSDGQLQVTYYGQPLYLYRGDTKPGEEKGQLHPAAGGSKKLVVMDTDGEAYWPHTY